MPVPAIFYSYCCKSPVKSTNQVGRFYHMTFQNAPQWSQGTRLKCHIIAIGKRNHQVCLHLLLAKQAIFASNQICRNRHIKSPGKSPALQCKSEKNEKLELTCLTNTLTWSLKYFLLSWYFLLASHIRTKD